MSESRSLLPRAQPACLLEGHPALQRRALERWGWRVGASCLFGVSALWACSSKSSEPAPPAVVASTPEAQVAPAQPVPAVPGAPPSAAPGAAAPSPAVAAATPDAGAPPSPNVKLVFRTFPSRPAVVMWGGKRLGIIDKNKPLVVERPRDSGPLDLLVRSTGFLPVHTRAYTFNDANIDVKITPLEKKDTLYGYQQPLPPDAGVPFPGEATEIPE